MVAARTRSCVIGTKTSPIGGFVTMKPIDPTQRSVRPAMTHFFYMDEKDPSKVAHWYGSVGPVAF
jgi:hypothetical protein